MDTFVQNCQKFDFEYDQWVRLNEEVSKEIDAYKSQPPVIPDHMRNRNAERTALADGQSPPTAGVSTPPVNPSTSFETYNPNASFVQGKFPHLFVRKRF